MGGFFTSFRMTGSDVFFLGGGDKGGRRSRPPLSPPCILCVIRSFRRSETTEESPESWYKMFNKKLSFVPQKQT